MLIKIGPSKTHEIPAKRRSKVWKPSGGWDEQPWWRIISALLLPPHLPLSIGWSGCSMSCIRICKRRSNKTKSLLRSASLIEIVYGNISQKIYEAYYELWILISSQVLLSPDFLADGRTNEGFPSWKKQSHWSDSKAEMDVNHPVFPPVSYISFIIISSSPPPCFVIVMKCLQYGIFFGNVIKTQINLHIWINSRRRTVSTVPASNHGNPKQMECSAKIVCLPLLCNAIYWNWLVTGQGWEYQFKN